MSVNVLDQNGNLKKIAHGFSESKFNTFRSDVISNIEMTDTASKDYAVGDFLIMANGQLAQVTSPIYQDMTISLSNVRLTTVEEMIAAKADPADIPDVSKYQKIFTGTLAEWNQLTTAQKTAYDLANITDDLGTEADIVDAVTDGDMRAVTSNAVHDALESKISTSETVGLVKNDGSIDTKSYAEKVTNGTENNLAGLDQNGNLKDAGWSSLKTTTSASGNPISIPNLKSNQLAINPIITFEPIQAGSGTPSPSNVRAISGYDKIEVLSCGKNIWDGKYSVTGAYLSADGTENVVANWSITSYVPVKGGSNYVVSVQTGSNNPAAICWYDSNYNYINGIAWTASSRSTSVAMPANAKYLRASIYITNQEVQIEESETVTTYEPCNKITDLSESIGQTVYGGTLDVRTGKLTVTRKYVDMGSLSWSSTSNKFRAAIGEDCLKTVTGKEATALALCEVYEGNNDGTTASDPVISNNQFAITGSQYGGATYLLVKDSAQSTASDFTTYVTGKKFIYPLQNSFTIQLTPHEISLLKDYAYVSTNGTSMSFNYHNGEMASLADVSQLGETVNELGNTKPQNITSQTTRTSATAHGGIVVSKCGKLVIVSMSGIQAVSTGISQSIVTGLPKSTQLCTGIFVGGDLEQSADVIASGSCFWIEANGTSLNGHIGTNTLRLWGSLIYFTSE